jgi:hypothetical protein
MIDDFVNYIVSSIFRNPERYDKWKVLQNMKGKRYEKNLGFDHR